MMESKKGNVSVAMTTFNGGVFLKKQLDSILNQSVNVFEIIVCDDGSTDGTIPLLEEYSKKSNLKYYINEQNLGFVKNFEKALTNCSGDYIVLADQDDLWYPEKVETLLELIGDNILIHSNCDLINEQDQVIFKNFKGEITTHKTGEDFLFSNVVTGCTSMIHRDLLRYSIPFPEGLSYHDWYLAIHAAYLRKIIYTSESLTGYRQHSNQDTGSGNNEKSSIIRNCLNRIKGYEFSQIRSTKKQISNLKASLKDFSNDQDFHQKQLSTIKVLEEYVNSFFHYSYGVHYAKICTSANQPILKKIFNQLKFSIG